MHYTLRGKIARAHPYALDTTLTMEGAGAEAKATGEAIAAAKKVAEDHKKETSNPHKVTKEQVGLGNVDNTADIDKPVSTAQAEAIADAKKAGTDAQTAANNAQTAANNAQTAANNAQTYANEYTNEQVKKSSHYNLLVNSNFANPANQQNVSTLTGIGYTIDRWKNGSASSVFALNNGYIRIAATADSGRFFHYLEHELARDKKYTFAAKMRGTTTVQMCCASANLSEAQ